MTKRLYEILDEQKRNIDILKESGYLENASKAIDVQIKALKNGNKVLIAGNGGSAADAQHFAGEFVGRFLKEREALPAIALTTDSSVLTCIGNDYGYDEVFARQICALGNGGDVFIGISTSGNSTNIINAIKAAKSRNIITIGLLGKNGGKIADICDYPLIVPINETPRIQEFHTMTVHMMCEMIEKSIFN